MLSLQRTDECGQTGFQGLVTTGRSALRIDLCRAERVVGDAGGRMCRLERARTSLGLVVDRMWPSQAPCHDLRRRPVEALPA